LWLFAKTWSPATGRAIFCIGTRAEHVSGD
jgi:hypothetical protein